MLIFICVTLLLCQLIFQTGYSADFQSEVTGEAVTVTVKLGSTYANRKLIVEVFAPGSKVDNLKSGSQYNVIDEEILNNTFSNLYMVTADSQGVFSFSYQPGIVRGIYKMRIGGEWIYNPFEGYFVFSNESDVENVMTVLVSANATLNDFYNVFVKFESEEIYAAYQILELDKLPLFSYFDTASKEMKEIIIQRIYHYKSKIESDSDLVALFSESVFWVCLANQKSVADLDHFLESNKLLGEFSEEIFYKKIYCDAKIYDVKTKEALLKAFDGSIFKNKSNSEAAGILHDILLTTLFSKTESYGVIASVVELDKIYLESMGLDYSKYESNNIGRFKEVQEKRPFKDIKDFIAKFNAIPATNSNSSTTVPNTSRQSGGVSSVGNSVYKLSDEEKSETPPTAEVFSDLETVSWAKEAILYLAGKNILNGRGNNIFDPNASVTRAEFAKIITLSFYLPQGTNTSFLDVQPGAWYEAYVGAVYNNGCMKGSDELFGVNDPLTREDMVTVLYRLIEPDDAEEFNLSFSDSEEISDYAKASVEYFVKKGIVNGMTDNSFEPKSTATRAQIARLIYLLIK